MAMKYRCRCVDCGISFKQVTRHQRRCRSCLYNNGPDLTVKSGDFYIEVYTELMPYKQLNKLMSSIQRR